MRFFWSHSRQERSDYEVLFVSSVFFLAAAAWLSSTAFDPIHASRYSAGSLMIFLSLSGVWILVHGVSVYKLHLRRRRLRKSYPQHPWRGDFLDSEKELVEVEYRRLANAVLLASIILVSYIPLSYRPDNLRHVDNSEYVISIYMLIGFPLALYILYYLFSIKKYGRVSLGLQCFPFFLGEMLDVRLRTSRPFGVFKSMQVKLSCIEDSKKTNSNHQIPVVEYSDTLNLEPAQDYDPQRPLEMAILLQLPTHFLPTRLNTDRPRYWILEVSTDTPGLDFDVCFMVPVYARESQPESIHSQ